MLTIHDSRAGARPAPGPLAAPARPAPGLTVLVDPSRTLPLAGYLLRHGPALALERAALPMSAFDAYAGMGVPPLVPVDGELTARQIDRALETTLDAGFEVLAAEAYFDGSLPDRLELLAADQDIACVVVATAQPRKVRALSRAARAPVLALPPAGEPAGGPLVVEAGDADHAAAAIARISASEHVTIVGARDPVRPGTWRGAEDAAARCRSLGMLTETIDAPQPDAVLTVAEGCEGIVVAVDRGGWRAPARLRQALAAGRACLLVPGPPQAA